MPRPALLALPLHHSPKLLLHHLLSLDRILHAQKLHNTSTRRAAARARTVHLGLASLDVGTLDEGPELSESISIVGVTTKCVMLACDSGENALVANV